MSSWLGIKDLQSRSNFLSTRISKSQVIIADKTRQVHLTRSVKNSQNNHTVSRVNKQCWSWGQKGPRFPSAHFPIAPPALVIPCWGQLHTWYALIDQCPPEAITASLRCCRGQNGMVAARGNHWGWVTSDTTQRRMQCYSPNAQCLLEKGCGVIKNRSMKDYLHFKNG